MDLEELKKQLRIWSGFLAYCHDAADAIESLQAKVAELESALRAVNAVAIERGDKYGACDEIDNHGEPYQSQWFADLLKPKVAPVE